MGKMPELSAEFATFLERLNEMRTQRPDAEEALAELEGLFQRSLVRYSVHMLDTLDFHHMAEDIAAGHLSPRYVPVLRSAASVLSATPWPEGLRWIAQSLRENVVELERALVENREREAEASSHEVHEQEHRLAHEAREWLS
ncbi:MAG TPA: hypothetical protein VIL58_03600 [Thermoplasmata archaeon]